MSWTGIKLFFLLTATFERVYKRLTMKRKNIHLTERQIEELQRLSVATGLKSAEIVRRAIDDYLIKEGKKK